MNNSDYSLLSVIFTKYYKRLVLFCTSYVSSREMAEDIVQNCFVKLCEKSYVLTDVSAGMLLYTMVRNACFNELKRRAVLSKFEVDLFRPGMNPDTAFDYDFLGTVENQGLYSDLSDLVDREVAKLPERCREIFVLSRFEGLSNAEIAAKLGISQPAVHKNIERALKKLEKVLK